MPRIHPAGGSLKAAARYDETQFANAITQFYADYGYYPCNKNTGGDANDYLINGGPGEAQLFKILADNEADNPIIKKMNPRGTIYLDVPSVRDPVKPKSGIGPDGVWYDPWGNPYLIKIDNNYNGIILNPYSANAGPAQLKLGVIVWSLGPDGQGATSPTANGDKNKGIFQDDVTTWH